MMPPVLLPVSHWFSVRCSRAARHPMTDWRHERTGAGALTSRPATADGYAPAVVVRSVVEGE